MSDPVTPPPAAPVVAHHSAPSDFDQAQLETIKNSETLARSAQKADYNATLIDEGMLAVTPTKLLSACQLWRNLSGQAVDATNALGEVVNQGTDAETLLKQEVEYYRAKARLSITQHPGWTAGQIDAVKARYFIGTELFNNEGTAGQSVSLLLEHAAADHLPGLKPERLVQSGTILQSFLGNPGPTIDKQSEATRRRSEREAAFQEVMRLRHEIQLCANTAWPWHNNANIAYRREFLIPIGRPFTV